MTSCNDYCARIASVLSAGVGITRYSRFLLAGGMVALATAMSSGAASASGAEPWITTWAATPAPRWAEELPVPFDVPEVLGDQTIRQIARTSVGGDQMRIVISNEFGTRHLALVIQNSRVTSSVARWRIPWAI